VLVVAVSLGTSTMGHDEDPQPLVSVYATNPSDPQISYDQDPYLHAPAIPENPTVVYPDSQTGALSGIADPYAAQGPSATTSDPDTYSLSPASVYYTPPTPTAGPYKKSGVPLKFDFGTFEFLNQPDEHAMSFPSLGGYQTQRLDNLGHVHPRQRAATNGALGGGAFHSPQLTKRPCRCEAGTHPCSQGTRVRAAGMRRRRNGTQ
jgi:hypothetical protein